MNEKMNSAKIRISAQDGDELTLDALHKGMRATPKAMTGVMPIARSAVPGVVSLFTGSVPVEQVTMSEDGRRVRRQKWQGCDLSHIKFGVEDANLHFTFESYSEEWTRNQNETGTSD